MNFDGGDGQAAESARPSSPMRSRETTARRRGRRTGGSARRWPNPGFHDVPPMSHAAVLAAEVRRRF